MVNILNIIDRIYESKYFSTILLIATLVLIVLFIAVTILGLRDAKKSKEPKKEKIEDVKDITFESQKEIDAVKEDVTFEIPVLTKNLENFKKSLEEEMMREDEIKVTKRAVKEQTDAKPTKILDKKTIDDTAILPILSEDSLKEIEQNKKELPKQVIKEQPKEEEKPHKRDILKELFKDRKEKVVEPPKVKLEENAMPKLVEQPKREEKRIVEQPKREEKRIVVPSKQEPKISPLIVEQQTKPKTEEIKKTQSRYTDDDDF